MPLRWGIVMSATMTSGCSFLAAATNARPSSTRPTSSKSSARRRFNPSPTTRWSSASSTRGRLTAILSLQRHPGCDRRTMARAALDVDPAAEQEDSLSHAGMTQAGPGATQRRIESGAVVPDAKLEPAVQALERDLGPARSGVAHDIAQALLRDAKQAERDIAREPLGDLLEAQL